MEIIFKIHKLMKIFHKRHNAKNTKGDPLTRQGLQTKTFSPSSRQTSGSAHPSYMRREQAVKKWTLLVPSRYLGVE